MAKPCSFQIDWKLGKKDCKERKVLAKNNGYLINALTIAMHQPKNH